MRHPPIEPIPATRGRVKGAMISEVHRSLACPLALHFPVAALPFRLTFAFTYVILSPPSLSTKSRLASLCLGPPESPALHDEPPDELEHTFKPA